MTITVKDWGEKSPTEELHVGIDMTPALNEGDTPATATWAWITQAGLVKANEQISGNKVMLELSGGTDGQTGRIRVTVTTTDGEVLEEIAKLKVRARN